AEAFAGRGAEVVLVLGPGTVLPQDDRIRVEYVVSADDMLDACLKWFPESDVTVLSAAVADYKPAEVAERKIKKKDDQLTLQLVKTPDIAATLGAQKRTGQCLVGFALETDDEEKNDSVKLMRKNRDKIVVY